MQEKQITPRHDVPVSSERAFSEEDGHTTENLTADKLQQLDCKVDTQIKGETTLSDEAVISPEKDAQNAPCCESVPSAKDTTCSGRNNEVQAPSHSDLPHSSETGEKPASHSFASRCFKKIALVAPLFLIVLLFAQTWTSFLMPQLYSQCEISAVQMLQNIACPNQYYAPMQGNNAAWPVMSLLAALIARAPLPQELLIPVLSFLCAGTALLGTWFLALSCGLGSGVACASACIMLSCVSSVVLCHSVTTMPLTIGLMTFAMAAFINGWKQEKAWLSLPLAFICTSLAGLTGGFLPYILPLVSSVLFVIWTGRFRRAQRIDALLGFVLVLAIPLCWFASLILSGNHAAYLRSLYEQILSPFSLPFWPPSDPIEKPILVLIFALAPWPLLIPLISWGRVLRNLWKDFVSSRNESCGNAWLWISFFVGLACCMITSEKSINNIALLVPFAAILLASALLRLTPLASRILYFIIALCAVIFAILLSSSTVPFIVNLLPFQIPNILQQILVPTIPVLMTSAGILVACVVLVRFTDKGYADGALLVTTVLFALLTQPIMYLWVPQLNGTIIKPIPSPVAPEQPMQNMGIEKVNEKPLSIQEDAVASDAKKEVSSENTSVNEKEEALQRPSDVPADLPIPNDSGRPNNVQPLSPDKTNTEDSSQTGAKSVTDMNADETGSKTPLLQEKHGDNGKDSEADAKLDRQNETSEETNSELKQ